MRKILVAALLGAAALGAGVASAAPSPQPSGTPPPEIYHTVSRPLCSALHTNIAPAIGMMMQNNQTIAKSPPLFQDYVNQSLNNSDAGQNIAVLRLENLVSPLADNVLAIQKMLEDPSIFPNRPQSDDDKRLVDLKQKMLTALASQQAALDIINGFVATQQLSSMQHEGFGFIASITQGDISGPGSQTNSQALTDLIGPTADPLKPPLFDNTALQAGLAPNPYEIDLTKVPGLALGYNPVSKLKEGVQYVQSVGSKSQATLAQSVVETAKLCGGQAPDAAPSPTP